MENIDKVVEFLESEINRVGEIPNKDHEYWDYIHARDILKKYKTYARVNQSTDLERQSIDETIVPPYELKINNELVGNLNVPPVSVTLSDVPDAPGYRIGKDINKNIAIPDQTPDFDSKNKFVVKKEKKDKTEYAMIKVPVGSLIVPPGMEEKWALQILTDKLNK